MVIDLKLDGEILAVGHQQPLTLIESSQNGTRRAAAPSTFNHLHLNSWHFEPNLYLGTLVLD